MPALANPLQAPLERTVERVRRTYRSMRVRQEQSERRSITVPRNERLNNIVDDRLGYVMLPAGTLPAVPAAAQYAQHLRDSGAEPTRKKHGYNPAILDPKRYEEAPAIFDLVLSDEVLQIASQYLGEIPVLIAINLWLSPANQTMKGSQLYHRDGRHWFLRRAKFLINMDAVGEDNGPFTFLPADVSARVSRFLGTAKEHRLSDELVYQEAKSSDAIRLVGPTGTGAFVDSSRCYHHGARVECGERLLLMFQFLPRVDARDGGTFVRTEAFAKRFGRDRLRELVIPNAEY